MRWDFFYDGDMDGPYNNLDDWYEEVRHLVWPTAILIGLMAIILIYVFCYHA